MTIETVWRALANTVSKAPGFEKEVNLQIRTCHRIEYGSETGVIEDEVVEGIATDSKGIFGTDGKHLNAHILWRSSRCEMGKFVARRLSIGETDNTSYLETAISEDLDIRDASFVCDASSNLASEGLRWRERSFRLAFCMASVSYCHDSTLGFESVVYLIEVDGGS